MLCFSELLAAPLSRFFVGYAELLELTTLGMKLYSLSFLLCGFNIFGSAFFTALNNGIVSAVISFLRTLVFQVTAIIEYFGNADAVPQPPERCLSRKAGIVRYCLKANQPLPSLRQGLIFCVNTGTFSGF